MEANELRIGNIVNTAVGVIRIEEIPLKSNPLYNPKALHPIPLTEEWLLRFGFEIIDGEWINQRCIEFGILIDKENDPPILHIWDGAFTNAPCEFVHQLQNLYFALTSIELQCAQ